jgi:hypothetical protein
MSEPKSPIKSNPANTAQHQWGRVQRFTKPLLYRRANPATLVIFKLLVAFRFRSKSGFGTDLIPTCSAIHDEANRSTPAAAPSIAAGADDRGGAFRPPYRSP